jgi:two-component system response regulator NreC
MTKNRTTIVLADDHRLVRKGFAAILSSQADFEVVGEADDGLQAIECVKQFSPRILLLDLMLARLHGLEVLRQINESFPETRAIVVSIHREEAYVSESLRNGAAGYVLKDATECDLIEAVRKVAAGRHYLSAALEDLVFAQLEQKGGGARVDSEVRLTVRERIVLQLAAEGLSAAKIAGRLFISPRTVETHRANLMQKLHLHSQTDLVRLAIRQGIISL